MLNKDILQNGSTVIHSNPQDSSNGAVTPPSDVTWAIDTSSYGSLTLPGGLNQDATFHSNGLNGVTVVTMACQGKSAQVSVTVTGPVALPFDHFAPSFD